MKKRYEKIVLEILRFSDDDVITASGGDNLGGWHDTWENVFDGGVFGDTEE